MEQVNKAEENKAEENKAEKNKAMEFKAEENKPEIKKVESMMPNSGPGLCKMITSHKFRNLSDLLINIDSVDDLLVYLERELNDFDKCKESIRQAFKKHRIDGYAFQNMKDEDILEMDIDPELLSLGQRLHLLSKTAKVKRAVRYLRRREPVLTGECFVSPPGLDGKFEMTQSYLKFTYEAKYEPKCKEIKTEGCLCFAKTTFESEVSTVKYLDHIDISIIGDVDVQEIEIESKTYQPTCCWGYCCKSEPETEIIKKNIVYIELNAMSDVGMFIAGSDDQETTVVEVHLPSLQEAENFQSKLIDLMNETQFQEGVH